MNRIPVEGDIEDINADLDDEENHGGSPRRRFGNRRFRSSEIEFSDDDLQDIALSKERWKNRRRMAWLCLFFFFSVTFYMMFKMDLDRLKAIDEIYTWMSIFCLTVIGAYMGATTYADISLSKGKGRSSF